MQMRLTRAILSVALGVAVVGCDEKHTGVQKVPFLHLGAKPGSVPTERRVELTAVPAINHDRYGYSLTFPANSEGIEEVYCGSDAPAWLDKLVPGGAARVIVWGSKEVTSYSDDGSEDYYMHWELAEIWVGNTCLFDAAICPVHKVRMERGLIPIHYGFPAGDFLKALQPFSGGPGFSFGGCCVSSSDPKETFGYRCSECVAGYQDWCKKQQDEKKIDGQQAAPSDGEKPLK